MNMTNQESKQAWMDMLVICERRFNKKPSGTPFHVTEDAANSLEVDGDRGLDEAKMIGHGETFLPTMTEGIH